MTKWAPAIIDGGIFDLSHLHPFGFEHVIAAKDGKPEQRYCVATSFSLHCFTTRIDPSRPHDRAWEYSDTRETRLFDETRYEHSKQLRGIIDTLQKRKCFQTGHGNFFTIELLTASGQRVDYGVYFLLTRPAGSKTLNLFVQSAYLHDRQPRTRPRPPRPIRFNVLVFNVFRGKPIHS